MIIIYSISFTIKTLLTFDSSCSLLLLPLYSYYYTKIRIHHGLSVCQGDYHHHHYCHYCLQQDWHLLSLFLQLFILIYSDNNNDNNNNNDNDRAAQDKVEALLELSQVQQRMELMVTTLEIVMKMKLILCIIISVFILYTYNFICHYQYYHHHYQSDQIVAQQTQIQTLQSSCSNAADEKMKALLSLSR